MTTETRQPPTPLDSRVRGNDVAAPLDSRVRGNDVAAARNDGVAVRILACAGYDVTADGIRDAADTYGSC